jgi:RNA polymerase sigma factor (sigma-70 family)
MRDTEIVASIMAGDPIGLAMAYDRYADPLFKYCASLLGDPADAADAVQDTFVVAASRLDGLREPERFRSWLYAVARNESLGILRSKKRTSALAEAPDVTDRSADVSERAERAELRALFEDAAAGLNPGEREVIELQLRQGLEAGEVASVLGVSRNHVHTLLSRARSQLEACLGVLLVARAAASAGRDECGELGVMLAGWDGRLTVLLRKRVHRHIEHCATCTARRAFELRPAMLLGLSPGAAMAAGAAESLRLAFGAPPGLKSHTVALATGHGTGALAHGTAVLSRTGAFGRHGFPKPAPVGLTGHHGVAGGAKALRSSPRGQAAVAVAAVAAVAVAAVAFALTGRDGHVTPSANPKPPATVPPTTGPLGPPPSAAAPKPVGAESTASKPTTGAPAMSSRTARPPTTAKPAAGTPTARTTPPTRPARTSVPPARPTPTPTRASTTARPAPSPTRSSSTPPPPPPPAPPPPPVPPPPPPPVPGILSVLPNGGTMIVIPGLTGSLVTLRASGGAVTWSVSVANDPDRVVTVSPVDSGTLTPSHPTTTLTIRTSQFLRCGAGTGTACPAITISPGGARLAVWTGWTLPFSPGGGRPTPTTPAGPPPGGATRRITIR